MSNPREDENEYAKLQELALTIRQQKLFIGVLEKKIVYLQEKVMAQDVMLKDALIYTNELEMKIKFLEKES